MYLIRWGKKVKDKGLLTWICDTCRGEIGHCLVVCSWAQKFSFATLDRASNFIRGFQDGWLLWTDKKVSPVTIKFQETWPEDMFFSGKVGWWIFFFSFSFFKAVGLKLGYFSLGAFAKIWKDFCHTRVAVPLVPSSRCCWWWWFSR